MANRSQDELDRALDAALAKYAAEPRAGLEERVLANLQAETARGAERAWWRWSVLAAVAAMAVLAVALSWRPDRPTHPTTHVAVTTPATQPARTKVVTSGEQRGVRLGQVARKPPKPHAIDAVVAVALPKLDQFPSPQPLSEQEKLLLDYVERFPEEAARVAEAQTALARREELEMYSPQATQTKSRGDEKTE